MFEKYLTIQQVWFTDRPRHWSPACEPYTGADSLISALRSGWEIGPTVYRRTIYYGGARHTLVYTFTLELNSEVRHMAVISTPFIVSFLAKQPFMVLQVDHGEVVEEAEEPILTPNGV